MAKYLTELVGTFFLVLTIGLCVTLGAGFTPIAIGCALMVLVYMGGSVSGAHYNPAVSVALLIRGKMKAGDLAPYIVAQVGGALLAAVAVQAMTGKTFAPAPAADATLLAVLLAEVLFTFALVAVVLNVATAPKNAGNSYFGAAIGLTVLAGAVAAGPISGGAFNPAVGIGPIVVNAVMGDGGFGNLWIYLAGPLAGAVLAALFYKVQHAGEKD